jgi:transposase-like protein
MAQLTAPQFDCLYRQDQMSLRAIAARVGVKRNVISKLARTYGIELRSPHITRPIDPDWIYHEYVEEHRTITDMAQEIGVSIQALSRRAKSIGIAVWRDPRQRQGTTPPHRVGGTS